MALSGTASPAAARSNPLWVAWLWMLLATIAAHAMLPVGSPIVRGNGSAFSVATVDVALAPKRKRVAEDHAVELRDPGTGASRSGVPDRDLPFLATPSVVLPEPWRQSLVDPGPSRVTPAHESVLAGANRARAPPAV